MADDLAVDARADDLTPGQLGNAALRRVLTADPDSAARRAAAARRRRYVRLCDPVDGTATIIARVRAEEARLIIDRIDRTARGMRGEGDPRDLDTLRADLFVEWLTGRRLAISTGPAAQPQRPQAHLPVPTRASPEAPWPTWRSVDGYEPWWWSRPPPRQGVDPEPDDPVWDAYLDEDDAERPPADEPAAATQIDPPSWRLPVGVEVQVVLSMATLLGLDDEPAHIRGYGAVPKRVVDDLVDAARQSGAPTLLRGLFCDPIDGRLVAMEQSGRFFTGGLRDFELCRDQQCRLTGGPVVDVDHRLEHRNGGRTTGRNGQCLGQAGACRQGPPGSPGRRGLAAPPR